MTYTETDLAAAIEQLSGSAITSLSQTERDQFDQFHAGGAEAVERLLASLHLEPGMTVLDVGSGLGGPARQVARTAECQVVGIDVTPAYVEVARTLTDAAGLGDRVQFVCTDVPAFDGGGFDAAYTMHVQMNVEDKTSFFAEIARRLAPGARLAIFDVCRNGEAEPTPPLPWSLDGTDSYLVTADELRTTIESCGFTLREWTDDTTWVRLWFEQAAARMGAAGTRATLPAILADGPIRMLNYAAALANDVVSVHRATFTRD
jgi:cyclopropane fatty-acyl-phospholipid synthase-like methyltransferase